MSGVNKAIIIGRLGSDPETRYTKSGQAVANFNLATDERWTDRNDQRQERTEWHRIVLWGRNAELAKEYLRKGRQVYIEGRLQTREWQDKNGNNRQTTEIVGAVMQFLDGGGDRHGQPQGQQGYQRPEPTQGQGVNGPAQNFDDDDIPF